MRFFLDANETPAILEVIRPVFYQHEFSTADAEGLDDFEDIPLFGEVAGRGFDAIITRDKNQLRNPQECYALRASGLHWIGHKEPDTEGLAIITSLTAGYLAAFPHVLDALAGATEPTSFRIKAVPKQLNQRVTVNPIPVGEPPLAISPT